VIATLFVLLSAPFILLNVNRVQNFAVHKITDFLEKKLQTTVRIEHVSMHFFNDITLKNMYIEDLEGDTLLFTAQLYGHISLFRLLHKEIYLTTLELDTPQFNLKVNRDGTTNLDFITQLIPETNQSMTFRVNKIEIVNGGFKLRTAQQLNPKNKAAFKANNLEISKFNTIIRLDKFLKTDIIGKIKTLNFVEKSGFAVSNVVTEFQMTDSTCVMPFLTISLPNSELEFDTISLKYNHLSDLSNNINALNIRTELLPSNIYCPDLQAFLPELGHFRRKTTISCELSGHLDNIKAKSLHLRYGSDIVFDGDFEFSGLPRLNETFVYASLNEIRFTVPSLQDLIANITQRPFTLPAEFRNFGKCKYSGNIAGFFSNMVLFGQLTTGVGNISTDVSLELSNNMRDLFLNGLIRSKRLQLARISPNQSGLGDIAFNVKTQLQVGENRPLKSTADLTISSLTYKNHTYSNIKVKGDYSNKKFTGDIDINDDNGQLAFGGQVDLNANSYVFNFNAHVKKFRPYALNLTTTNPNLEVSFNIDSEFEGPNIDHMNGEIRIDSILLANNKEKYFLDNFVINAKSLTNTANQGISKTLSVQSDILTGKVSGNYTIGTLLTSLKRAATQYFPIIRTQTVIKQSNRNNTIDLAFELGSTQQLAKVLNMNWFTTQESTINGRYDDIENTVNLDVHVPILANKKDFVIENISIAFNNENKTINGLLHAQTTTRGNDTISLNLDLKGMNDSIKAYLFWENSLPSVAHSGEILVNTHFAAINKEINAFINILPTQMVIQNDIWDIAASNVTTNFKELTVNHFNIESDKQHIHVNGKTSHAIEDLLTVDLQNIDLEFISNLFLSHAAIEFGGLTTGKVHLTQLFNKPIIEANVDVTDFFFNRAYWGNVHATSNWDNINKKINFGGFVLSDSKDTIAMINGGFYIENDYLDLRGKANRLDLRFLDYYLADVLQNVQGYGSGDIHVYGDTRKQTVTVTVDALVEEAQASIDFLRTTYFFNDSIHVTPTEIKLTDITVLDAEGNKGKLNGYVTHNYFEDLKYYIELDCNRMKVLNTTKKDNTTFYGTAYATGKAIIEGTETQTNITVTGVTEKNSRLVVPFGSSVATENAFITFVNHNTPMITPTKETKPTTENDNEINLNLKVEVNPNAEIQLLVDLQAGDIIKARGDGNLRMEYNTKNEDFRMYGNYEIEQGSYLFTFQNALRKDFKVTQGGTIDWNGDPFNPVVNLRATYQVNASLLDILDKSILESSNRTTVPVQCILNLTGNIMSPAIKFDLNLPNSEEELNRALKAVVNTDEMMNREIIYLLVLGKFFTPESMKSTTASVINQNDLLAVASSTLSTQLNNWASQMFDNWNFGVNFRSTGEGNERSNEYEFNFLYTPNNRITFNGNVGYRDDNLSASKFIGDFDFEYTLIESGKLSAKAYTHTNDYKEFKSALTTQGIGLVYRESFNSLAELWDSWKANAAERKREREEKKKAREEKAILKEEEKDKGK